MPRENSFSDSEGRSLTPDPEDGSGLVSLGCVLSTRGGGFTRRLATGARKFDALSLRLSPRPRIGGIIGIGMGSWLGLERILIVESSRRGGCCWMNAQGL